MQSTPSKYPFAITTFARFTFVNECVRLSCRLLIENGNQDPMATVLLFSIFYRSRALTCDGIPQLD